jgi:hypothetical protein
MNQKRKLPNRWFGLGFAKWLCLGRRRLKMIAFFAGWRLETSTLVAAGATA